MKSLPKTGRKSPANPTESEAIEFQQLLQSASDLQVCNIILDYSLNAAATRSRGGGGKPRGHWHDWQIFAADVEFETRENPLYGDAEWHQRIKECRIVAMPGAIYGSR